MRYDEADHGLGGSRPLIYAERPETGELGILYGSGGVDLPLLVATTARGAPQLALVRRDIETKMRKW